MKGQTDREQLPLHYYYINAHIVLCVSVWAVRHAQLNKGMCEGFEQHVRCLMATGATARAIREGLFLNASHYLSPSEADLYCSEVPKLDWFIKQRLTLNRA